MERSLIRAVIRHGLIPCGIGCLTAAVAAAQSPPSSAEEPSVASPAEPKAASFGVVIRLAERIFQPRGQQVDQTNPVCERIVGVCNIGTAHVTGDMTADLKPKTDGIAMDLIFRGTSTARTVARQSSARICTTAVMRVEVSTPITFQLETGFVAGRATSHATLAGVCRNIDAEVPGLRGHFVRRFARDRICEQQRQIRYQSEQATRRNVAEETRVEVEKQLKSWNAHWEPLRQSLIAQSWFEGDRDVNYASDEQHLILYIAGSPPAAAIAPGVPPPIRFPPKALPDPVPNGIVDVIFYTDESQKAAVTNLLKLVESVIDEYAADQPIADRLSFATDAGSDWVKLSVSAQRKTPETEQ